MFESNKLEIYNETKTEIPNFRFLDIVQDILGPEFELSFSVLNPESAKKINFKQRKQKYIPNTLSFLYSENSGEIIITPDVVKNEMEDFEHTYEEHFLFLFIHSLLHLKKLDHGPEMESLEEKYFKKYK